MTQTLRCAIVGTGTVGHFHARAQRVAVTNQTRSKADACAAQWGNPAV